MREEVETLRDRSKNCATPAPRKKRPPSQLSRRVNFENDVVTEQEGRSSRAGPRDTATKLKRACFHGDRVRAALYVHINSNGARVREEQEARVQVCVRV